MDGGRKRLRVERGVLRPGVRLHNVVDNATIYAMGCARRGGCLLRADVDDQIGYFFYRGRALDHGTWPMGEHELPCQLLQ